MSDIEIYKQANLKIHAVPESKLLMWLGQLVTKTALVAGYNLTDNQLDVILQELPIDLTTRFKVLELPEIETALAEGVRGYYGDFMGISTKTCCSWLKYYLENKHNEYLLNKNKGQKQLTMKTEPTAEEVDKMMRAGINQCFEQYKNTGELIDFGNVRFRWLRDNGYIELTSKEINEYKEEALERFRYEQELKKQNGSRIEYQDAKRVLSELEQQGMNYNPVISLARVIALKVYFENIIESRVEFKL